MRNGRERIVEAGNQIEDRAPARAARFNQCQDFSSLDIQRNILQDGSFSMVREGKILKAELTARRRHKRGIRLILDCGTGIQNLEDPLHSANG